MLQKLVNVRSQGLLFCFKQSLFPHIPCYPFHFVPQSQAFQSICSHRLQGCPPSLPFLTALEDFPLAPSCIVLLTLGQVSYSLLLRWILPTRFPIKDIQRILNCLNLHMLLFSHIINSLSMKFKVRNIFPWNFEGPAPTAFQLLMLLFRSLRISLVRVY